MNAVNTTISVPTFTITSTSTPFSFPTLTPPSNTPPVQTSPVQQPISSLPPSDLTSAPASNPESTPEPSETIIIVTPSSNGQLTTIVITSTQSVTPATAQTARASSTKQISSASSSATALQNSPGNSTTSSGGLTPGGKIAVAVVVPVAAVALLVLAALFFWRRRRQRKDAEELRRKEVEEYTFNPNEDPTLPVAVEEHKDIKEAGGAGYRGWGTTSTARKPSTTLSGGNGGIGVARSDSGSNPGGTDVQSGDPLVGSPGSGRPATADSETIGALGSAPAAAGNRQDRDIHRGPSNASSAYSGGHRSDASDGVPGNASGTAYYNDGIYYEDGMPQHGPYGDGTYSGGQPVIRDVQARRNTRIENPTVFPQQGNAGIAQNF